MQRQPDSFRTTVAPWQATPFPDLPAVEANRQAFTCVVPDSTAKVVAALEEAGWHLRTLNGALTLDKTSTLTGLRQALHLPSTVNNYDALADALRDLATWVNNSHVVLVWHQATMLRTANKSVWQEVCDILQQAHQELAKKVGDAPSCELHIVLTPDAAPAGGRS